MGKGTAGGEEGYLRLDIDAERGNVSLDANVAVSQRAREMYEALGSSSHAGQMVGGRRGRLRVRVGVDRRERSEASSLCLGRRRDVAKFR